MAQQPDNGRSVDQTSAQRIRALVTMRFRPGFTFRSQARGAPIRREDARTLRTQRGMVTIELAVAILVAAFITGMLCWVVALIGLRTVCQDNATEIARQLARGDQAAAMRVSDAIRPATAEIRSDGDDITVAVRAEARWGALGPVTVRATAAVTREPGVQGPR